MSEFMINLAEDELLLLETYLDGELSAEESDAVARRLNDDPNLAAALNQLSAQRQLRQNAFTLLEREEITAAQSFGATDGVARSLRIAATREVAWSGRLRMIRTASALAACLMVGIGVGWLGHSGTSTAPRGNSDSPNHPMVSQTGITPVSMDTSPHRQGFNVAITDDAGNVLAQQHFDSFDKAREFSNDLLRFQNRQRQVRQGEIRLIGDDF